MKQNTFVKILFYLYLKNIILVAMLVFSSQVFESLVFYPILFFGSFVSASIYFFYYHFEDIFSYLWLLTKGLFFEILVPFVLLILVATLYSVLSPATAIDGGNIDPMLYVYATLIGVPIVYLLFSFFSGLILYRFRKYRKFFSSFYLFFILLIVALVIYYLYLVFLEEF